MSLKFPADFDKCVREGGRVKTVTPKEGTYIHVCWDKAGKSHSGEVKHTKKEASEVNAYLANLGYTEQNGDLVMGSDQKLKFLIPQIELAFKEGKISEIEMLQAGEWEHPQYGVIAISEQDIDKFIQNFNDKVRKVDIAIDQEHMPEKGAAGWVRTMNKVFEDGKARLKATVEWTALGIQLLKDGVFKYFSPEFDFAYEDMETHEEFQNVLLGGALTNRPYFKSLAPVALSENMYAGFTSKSTLKGGEKEMTKEELKAKLVEDAAFVLPEGASDEEKASFEEVKVELAKEAEDKEKADVEAREKAEAEKKAKAEAIQASEKFISKEQHVKELNEIKSKMGVVEAKLRLKEVTEEVSGYTFSESNPTGVLLPKNQKKAIELLMAATPNIAKLFSEFLAELPKVSAKLFREEGGDGGAATKEKAIDAEVTKVMSERKIKYGEAVKILASEKPELFK